MVVLYQTNSEMSSFFFRLYAFLFLTTFGRKGVSLANKIYAERTLRGVLRIFRFLDMTSLSD